MSASFHAAPFPPKCASMRSIDLQIVWWRRRAQAPAPARPATVTCRGISPPPDQQLSGTSPAQLHGRMHPGLVSYHRAKQGSTPVGDSTAPLRQRSREAAWWDGPRTGAPARPFPRRFEDRCYGGWTVDRGRAPNRCEPTLTKLSAHERSREGAPLYPRSRSRRRSRFSGRSPACKTYPSVPP